jgi:multicomponent Na+:H+ antiporter subunit E
MGEPNAAPEGLHSKGIALLGRILLFSGLWWVLTEDYPGSWTFGLPVAVLAALTSLAFRSPPGYRWRLAGALPFIPYFIRQSWRGGLDVAGRAFHPRLPLAPGLLDFALRLPPGPARIFFADTMSLLPGTCSVELDPQGRLRIHALDTTSLKEADLRQLEHLVAAMFGVTERQREDTDE